MHTITKHDLTEDGTACIRRSYMLCQIITQRNISNNIQALTLNMDNKVKAVAAASNQVNKPRSYLARH